MNSERLADFGLRRKPHVARSLLRHRGGVRSDLQKLFVKRLAEEMGKRELSANALAAVSGVGQTSISRILTGRQDPTLQKVDALAKGMGIPGWFLMMEENTTQVEIIRPPEISHKARITKLPSPYPKVFTAQEKPSKYRASRKK